MLWRKERERQEKRKGEKERKKHETRSKEMCMIFLLYVIEISQSKKTDNRRRWGQDRPLDAKIGNQLQRYDCYLILLRSDCMCVCVGMGDEADRYLSQRSMYQCLSRLRVSPKRGPWVWRGMSPTPQEKTVDQITLISLVHTQKNGLINTNMFERFLS